MGSQRARLHVFLFAGKKIRAKSLVALYVKSLYGVPVVFGCLNGACGGAQRSIRGRAGLQAPDEDLALRRSGTHSGVPAGRPRYRGPRHPCDRGRETAALGSLGVRLGSIWVLPRCVLEMIRH